jgi:hypothetical protein
MAKTWFLFTGSTPCLPTDYMLVGSQPSCPGSDQLCAVFADPDGTGRPIITPSLCCDISWALNHGVDTMNVLLRA